MPEFADHQNQFDMQLHQVPLHVDEPRPLDSKFLIDEVLACSDPKKNHFQLFDPIQTGHPHLSGEHHVSQSHIAGYELQYNDSDPTLLVLEHDRKDLEAVQELKPDFPDFPDSHASINSNGYIHVVRTLRLELLHPGRHKVKHAKHYARLLLRLANELKVLPSENPSCKDNFLDPLPYTECLVALAKDMMMGKQLGPQDSGVYVLKDCAPYVMCLRLLATELSSG